MKVFLCLWFWALPLCLYAQTTVQGSFIPLQKALNIEYHSEEERKDSRFRFSLSSSGVQFEPYVSYEGKVWSFSYEPGISWEGYGSAVHWKSKTYVFPTCIGKRITGPFTYREG